MNPTPGGPETGAVPGSTPPRAQGPGRRPWWRRLLVSALRIAAGLLVAALLFVALALTFLHTPSGRSVARAALETALRHALGIEAVVGGVELHLWSGEATVTAVRLPFAGTTVTAQRVEGRWSRKGGLDVRLVLPAVVVRETGRPSPPQPPATGLTARPWRVLERLGHAEVEDGRVELQDIAGRPWLVLERIDATMKATGGRRAVHVAVPEAAVGTPGAGLLLRPVDATADLAIDGGRLSIETARVTARSSWIELHGAIERILPFEAGASARVSADAAIVEAFAPAASLGGRVESDASLSVETGTVTGTVRARTAALVAQGIGPWSATARGRIDGGTLVLESLSARGLGGTVTVGGRLALTGDATTDVSARLGGLDPAAVREVAEVGIPLATRIDGTLRWTSPGWDVASGRGSGTLVLRAAEGRGLPLSGGAELSLAGRRLRVDAARLEARGARAEGSGEVGPEGRVSARFEADAPLEAVDAFLVDAGLPRRPGDVQGVLTAEGEIDGPLAGPVVAARVRGEHLSARGRPFSLEAEGRYEGGRLSVAPLVVRSGEGTATVTGSLPIAADSGAWDLEGEATSLEMAPALALLGLGGHGTVGGALRVEGPRDAPEGRASLRASLDLEEEPGAVVVALEATSRGRQVEVERLEAEVAGGRVRGSGRYDASERALELTATAEGLRWDRLPLLPTDLRRLTGTLAGEASVTGSLSAPAGQVRLTLAEPEVRGEAFPPVSLEARSDGRTLEVTGTAAAATFLRGRAPLEGTWPFRAEIDASALPVQTALDAWMGGPSTEHGGFARATTSAGATEASGGTGAARGEGAASREHHAGQQGPTGPAGATVAATGTVSLDVPLLEPSAARYSSGDLALSGRIDGLEWRVLPFSLRGDAASVEMEGFRAEAGDAWLAAQGRAPFSSASPFDLTVDGHLDFAALDPALPARQLEGTGDLKVHVGGTRETPDLSGEVRLADVSGRLEDVSWDGLDLDARLAGRGVEVATFRVGVLGGEITAKGGLSFGEAPAPGPRLTFAVRDVDLGRVLDEEVREGPEAASLLVSLEGEVEARAPSLDALDASGRLTRLETRSGSASTLALEAPAEWRLEGGRIELTPVRLAGSAGRIEGRAQGRFTGAPSASVTLVGDVDARVLGPFLPGVTVSGPAHVDARIAYADERWRLEGGARLQKARLSLDTLNFTLGQIDAEARFEGDRVGLTATGSAGDGRLRASGTMRLGPSFLGPADVTLTAEELPLSYPPGFRGRATGEVRLTGAPGRFRLEGSVGLRRAYYTADFDAKSQSLGRLDWQLAALEGGSLADGIALDVRVRLDEPVRIRNATMRLDVDGSLVASGTLAQPVATGQISLREGGELTLGRARVRVDGGRVALNGYPAGTPEVDFRGATRVSGIAMDLRASGSLDDLQLDLSSDRNDLSQTDLVTLLLTGRTASAAASQGGVVVAEELASALGGVLQKGAGRALLVDVSPDRSLLTDDTDPTQRFNLGTRITQNLTVIYSAALDGTEKRWIVELVPGGGRLRLRAITEEDNSLSLEATDRFSFNLWSRGGAGAKTREIERLAALRFEGSLPLPEEELRRASGLRARRRYSALQRDQAADRVREALVEKGWRGATVEAETRRGQEGGGSGGLVVVLRVDPGPLVPIRWTGDEVGKRARRRAEKAWPPFATPEVAAAAVARAARVELQTDGYYAASVEPRVVEEKDRVDVTLDVTRGPRGAGIDVVFEGNEALGDAALLARLPKPGSREFFEALDPRSSRVANDVRLAYAGIGYVQARVRPAVATFDPASRRLLVTIPVRERGASRVAEVDLPAEVAEAGRGGPTLSLKAGEAFDLAAYVADRDAIAAWYRAEGWVDAQVRGVLEPRPGEVFVRYLADPGPRPRIGAVRIDEAGRTRESLVRRQLTVEKGDLVRPSALAESRDRLAEVGVFRSVDVRTEPRPGDASLRDLVVGLVDKPDVTVEYGLRYTTSGSGSAGAAPSSPSGGRLQVAGAFELTNPFGLGLKTRAYTFLTTKRQTWGVTFDAATLLGVRLRTQLFLFDDADQDIQVSGLASWVRGVTAQQTRVLLRDRRSARWHDRLRLQWGYTFKNIEYLTSDSQDLLLRGKRGFLSLALIGDERDSLTDPTRGVFWTATGELARRALGSDVDYVRLYGQLFAYVPVGPLVWAQGYRAGAVPGTDPLLLIENRFRAGGPTTVRGFEQNGLGPLTSGDDSFGGQAVVVLNQELRLPIWKRLHGGLFWDAGNVWLLSGGLDLGDLRQSVGAGLRLMFPFGPIRLEYAWVVDPREGESKGRLVFGLGHAF